MEYLGELPSTSDNKERTLSIEKSEETTRKAKSVTIMAEMSELPGGAAIPKSIANLAPPPPPTQRRSVTGYDAAYEGVSNMGGTELEQLQSVQQTQEQSSASKPKSTIQFGETETEGSGLVEVIATVGSIVLLIATLPLAVFFCFKVVQEYERAVIFRLGRLRKGGARGPGIFFILPCIDSYRCVDLRTVSFDVPPQEILTHDSVTVAVDAVVYYRVYNPTVAVSNVVDFSHSTRLLAATTLRNVLGTKNLADILSERESISQTMQASLDEATDPWGVKVERVEIKDVRLPVQLQRAMAAEAEAAREARAKVIAAEGEMKASRALKEASEVIVESPAALQLRYLQTLNTISAEKNSTIVFPLPIDIISPFLHSLKK